MLNLLFREVSFSKYISPLLSSPLLLFVSSLSASHVFSSSLPSCLSSAVIKGIHNILKMLFPSVYKFLILIVPYLPPVSSALFPSSSSFSMDSFSEYFLTCSNSHVNSMQSNHHLNCMEVLCDFLFIC